MENRVLHLEEDIAKLRFDLQEVIFNNRELKKQVALLNKDNDDLYGKLYYTELQLNQTNQYSRRSNIEINGIPENIRQQELETHIIKVLLAMGIKVVLYDIVAVHRLGKVFNAKPRNVIVRFVNRKYAELAIKSSFKLSNVQNKLYSKYYIVENLCPAMRRIFNRLYKLKKTKVINNVWTFNGQVFMKTSDDEHECTNIIGHFDDIDYFLDS